MLPSFSEVLPTAIAGLRQESNLAVIEPWFLRSIDVPGDVCEFGCFRGYLSIKMAFYLHYLRPEQHKYVYCFDTFEGFTAGAADGGFPRVGDYSDAPGACEDLMRWSGVLRLCVVRGDAASSCTIVRHGDPLSFVWFDLDLGPIMEDVRQEIWHLITPKTIIGIDDYGRPECPTVKSWAGHIEAVGLWRRVGHYAPEYIAFFERTE